MFRFFGQASLGRSLTLGQRFQSTSAQAGGSKAPLYAALTLAAAVGSYYVFAGGPPDPAKLKELNEKARGPAALDPNNWVNFKLKAIEKYNHDTSKFIFELPAGHSSGLTTCSAVLVKGDGLAKNGKNAIRPYTPISKPEDVGHIDFLIKGYPEGIVSKHFHSLKVGDEMPLKGPIPKFQYKANEFEHIALVGGGSGITPLYQLIDNISSNPSDKTKMTLVYANKSEQDILLREKFDQLAQKKPEQFKVVYALDNPPKSWSGLTGFLTKDSLQKYLPPATDGEKVKVFVCGPPGQMDAVSGNKVSPQDQGELKGALKELGYNEQQVYKF